MLKRKKTLQINIGSVKIGGDAPISVQSMTKTDTRDVKSTLRQIKKLEKAGCEVVRIAVPDQMAVEALQEIIRHTHIPVIADVHFQYRLALSAMDTGIDGLRINPGNISHAEKIALIVKKAKEKGIAIRVGVNSGSLEKDILGKYKKPAAEALVESALRNINILERFCFRQIKISMKSPDVRTTVEAYRLLSKKTNYPLHIGITESGTAFSGTVKSAAGLGILLEQGIGDTLRVSLTEEPVEEVRVGFEILKVLGLRRRGLEIISCPTCGRCQIEVRAIAKAIEKKLAFMKLPFKVAVMGCEVNGPGEAKEADIGVTGSKNAGVLFRKGRIIKRCPKNELLKALYQEIRSMGAG